MLQKRKNFLSKKKLNNKLKELLEGNGYTSIPMELSGVGYFHVKIKIDNVLTTFILDTGAASTIIDKSFAAENNLSMSETTLTGGGVGTSQLKIYKVEANHFQIDEYKMKKFEIYSVDLQHVKTSLTNKGETNLPQGVLGADILITKKAIIDYSGKRLYLN